MWKWFGGKKTGDLTAIGLAPDGIAVVRAGVYHGRARVSLCEWQPRDGAAADKAVARAARQHGLKQSRCTTVLDADSYRLVLTEAPPVAPEELKQAMRWRVKDLIDFHINDASFDVFDLPGAPVAGGSREVYVVAARNDAIQQRVAQLSAAGVGLEIIDIPELAQRNIAVLLPQDAEGLALVSLEASGGLITVTRAGSLYLARNLTIGLDQLARGAEDPRYFDQLVLEIQRSLDYFESHFRQAPVRHVRLAPMAQPVAGLIDYLRTNLAAQVAELDLSEIVEGESQLPLSLQAACFRTLGAALRVEEVTL